MNVFKEISNVESISPKHTILTFWLFFVMFFIITAILIYIIISELIEDFEKQDSKKKRNQFIILSISLGLLFGYISGKIGTMPHLETKDKSIELTSKEFLEVFTPFNEYSNGDIQYVVDGKLADNDRIYQLGYFKTTKHSGKFKVNHLTKNGKLYQAGLLKAKELAKQDKTTLKHCAIKTKAKLFDDDIYEFKFNVKTSPNAEYTIIASKNPKHNNQTQTNKTYFVSLNK